MLRIVRELTTKGVTVKFLKEKMVFDGASSDPMNKLMFTMLSAFSEFERSLIKERQREGIALAKKRGVYRGGKRKLDVDQILRLRNMVELKVPKAEIARQFRITRETVYQYLREEEAA